MKKKTVFRWWWSWNAEKTARWLEEMAAKGWILERTSFAMIIFHFHHGTPVRMSYCADFQSGDVKEYLAFIRDSGWTMVSETSGWYLWAREYGDGEDKPRFFSDSDSLVARNKRIVTFLVPISIPQIAASIIVWDRWIRTRSLFMLGLGILFLGFIGFLIYAMGRTLRENRRLKKRREGY